MKTLASFIHRTALIVAISAIGFALLIHAHATERNAIPDDSSGKLLKGQGALGDWHSDAPGVRRLITPSDLPKPYATPSADNEAHVVARPSDSSPKALPGFKVEQIATGLVNPRLIMTAPNGDLFVAESSAGRIRVLRGFGSNGNQITIRKIMPLASFDPGVYNFKITVTDDLSKQTIASSARFQVE